MAATESPPEPVSAPIPMLAVVGLALAAMASAVSLRLTDALLPRLADEFSISLGEASHVITAFAVAYGVAQLLFGPLGDRFGKFRVVAWACALSAFTALACALAPGHVALVIARLLAGATAAAVIPLSMAWIGDVVPYSQRQPVLARFLIGQIAGIASGVWIGGYAAEHLAWRTPFFVVAAFFAVVAGALQLVRRRLPAAAVRTATQPPAQRPTMVGEFAAVVAHAEARAVLLAVFLEGASLYGAFPFIAAHLHQRFGLSLSTVGALVMLFALGGLGFALGARTLVRRLGEVVLVRSGSMLMAAALLSVALAAAWWWAIPACAVMGLGFYMMHNTLQTQATQMAPERRGAAVAAFAGCFYLGQSAGVGLAGLWVGAIGTRWVLAAGAAGVLGVAWNYHRQRARIAGDASHRHTTGR